MNGQQSTQHRVVAIAVVAAVLGFLIFGSSCSLIMSSNWNPRGDWELPLCNGYYIFRTSSRDICVVHERDNYKDSFEDIIDSYITCFRYNSRYIAVRRLVVADRALLDDIQSVDTEAADYYLIDAETDTIYGPFAEKEDFERACKEQNVGDLGEWIPTYYLCQAPFQGYAHQDRCLSSHPVEKQACCRPWYCRAKESSRLSDGVARRTPRLSSLFPCG